MSYREKYLKYKKKYTMLRDKLEQRGGLKLNMNGVERLFKLYLRYYAKIVLTDEAYIIDSIHTDHNNILAYRFQDQYMGSEVLRFIEVDYTIDQIEQNFEKYGIIILRDPTKSKKLLLGCGTKPLIILKNHEHKDFTTINPQLSMNPTIVGAFGVDDGIERFFIDVNYKFDDLYGEAVTIAFDEKTAEMTADKLDKIMEPNYGVYELDGNIFFGKGREGFLNSYLVALSGL